MSCCLESFYNDNLLAMVFEKQNTLVQRGWLAAEVENARSARRIMNKMSMTSSGTTDEGQLQQSTNQNETSTSSLIAIDSFVGRLPKLRAFYGHENDLSQSNLSHSSLVANYKHPNASRRVVDRAITPIVTSDSRIIKKILLRIRIFYCYLYPPAAHSQ